MNDRHDAASTGALYTAAQIRDLERRAVDQYGIESYALMKAAASSSWQALRDRWPQVSKILVFCGPGNNGGDGFEIAAIARACGCQVSVCEPLEHKPGGDADIARGAWLAGSSIDSTIPQDLGAGWVIVDALFGIGFSRRADGTAAEAIESINAARSRGAGVLAVDVPSGLSSDDGITRGPTVFSDLTCTMIGDKPGLHLASGPDHAGSTVVDRLGIPEDAYADIKPELCILQRDALQRVCTPRARQSHKGSNGHVLLIGGELGTPGAILLSARAALRAGAGLVSVATRAQHAGVLAAAQPEVMFHGIARVQDLMGMLERVDVVAIGPGLGSGAWGDTMWNAVRRRSKLIVDADALNRLAKNNSRNDDWILTPHPGEAARLLEIDTAAVQSDRLGALKALQSRYRGCVVLKGSGTLISGAPTYLCPYGNPGMGTGGMGDALTGVIASLLGQGHQRDQAAAFGALAHALAGDAAAREGERGLLPSDLIDALRRVVNPAV